MFDDKTTTKLWRKYSENVHEYQLKTHKLSFMSEHLSMKGKKYGIKLDSKLFLKSKRIACKGKYYRV